MLQQVMFDNSDVWPDEVVDQYTEALCEVLIERATRPLFDRRCRESTREAAVNWLMSDAKVPFSFNCCCAVLGVSPDNLRTAILGMARAVKKRRAAE